MSRRSRATSAGSLKGLPDDDRYSYPPLLLDTVRANRLLEGGVSLSEQGWTGKIYSDGWVDAPETIDTIEPATGEVLGTAGVANASSVAAAAKSARRAQREWAALPMTARVAVVRRAGELLERHRAEISEWMVRESGCIPGKAAVEITASVRNKPTGQWEQVDLCWYYDDSNMVKLGQEMVDGQLSIVMGREQNDRARTVKIVPIDSDGVELRLVVSGNSVHGKFKTPGVEWRDVGDCDVPPAPQGKAAQVSLQFYQGLPDVEHWARVSEVTIRSADEK